MKHIAVIGAGIVGCTTAYALAQQGFRVTLLDAASGAASATSRANGAQLSYSYVEPLASPATLRGLPQLLVDPNSPLKFRLALDPNQWRWGLSFLSNCTNAQVTATTRALLALGELSRQTLDGWRAKEGWDCDYAMPGKLVLHGTQAGFERAKQQMLAQVSLGTQQLALSAAECAAREPALKSAIGRYAGGIWTASECVIDPYQLCSAITNSSSHNGIFNLFNCTVRGFTTKSGSIVSLATTQGDVQADQYVLCSGPQAASLLRPHGVYLPIYPIKGYSVTLPISDPGRAPTASITDLKRKTVFARLGQRLRVAGRAELVGQNLRVEPQHIATLIAATHALFPGACSSELTAQDVHAWAGLRPATPSGRPIIGASPVNNLLLNVGHGALGLTMAAGAAAIIAALASGRSLPLDPAPFGMAAA